MLSILLFTGKGFRSKSSASLYGSGLKRQRREGRPDNCEFDEEQQCYVPSSVRAAKAKEAKRLAAEQVKILEAKRAREEEFDALETLKNLSKEEFREMRKRRLYDLVSNSNDPFYPRNEMKLIKEELYDKLADKKKVCPQHPLNMDYLNRNEYFSEAVRVAKQLGLENLMVEQQDYDISYIHQFFATMVFDDDDLRSF